MTFLTADDVAELLAVDRSTVYRWVDGRGLPAYRIGGVTRFREDEVMAWIGGQKVGTPAPLEQLLPATPSRVQRLRAAAFEKMQATRVAGEE